MDRLKERWERVALPGDYLLGSWVGGSDDAGFFETTVPADGRRAIAKLVVDGPVDGAAQLALWERMRALHHRHLQELHDCGRAEYDGQMVVWGIFEHADETLAAALTQGPLTEGEAREVLEVALGVLRELKQHGLGVTALEPRDILAVGDTIKLCSDSLIDVAPDADITEAIRGFWSCISPLPVLHSAALLSEILGEPHRGHVAEPSSAPEAPKPAATVGPAPVSAAPALRAPAPEPAIIERQAVVPREPSRPFPIWVIVGAAILVAVIAGFNFHRSSDGSEAPTVAETPATQPSKPAEPVEPKPSPVAEPRNTRRAEPEVSPAAPEVTRPATPAPEASAAPPDEPAAANSGDGPRWRVIAYTYRSSADAARKASQIRQEHSGYDATVYSPAEKQGFFLVSLGAFKIRNQAAAMLERVKADGISRDAYIKKFSD